MNWDYLAGLWDGEGTISCSIGVQDGYEKPRCCLTLYQSEEPTNIILQAAQFLEDSGIATSTYNREPQGIQIKVMRQLHIRGDVRNRIKFLRSIIPHLIIKKSAASEALKFCIKWEAGEFANDTPRNCRWCGKTFTYDIKVKRTKFCSRECNKRERNDKSKRSWGEEKRNRQRERRRAAREARLSGMA